MDIEYLGLSEIKPYEKNPRKNESAVDAVAASIREFGFKNPIIVDKNNVIIAGHTRLKAAEKLGLTEVPVIRAEDLAEEQVKAFRIADNKVSELAGWDFSLLDEELEGILNIDMEEFGFDVGSLTGVGSVEEDEAPEEVEAKTRLGDIWQLGEHRVLCGDSTKDEDFDILMGEEVASISFTSPPYNASNLDIKGQEETKKKYLGYDDNMDEDEYFRFIENNVGLLLKYSREIFYNIGLVEANKRPIIRLLNQYIDQFKDVIYWKKDSVAPHIQGGVINNLVEFILCFGNGKRKFESAQFGQGTYWNVIEGSNASGNEYAKIHKATFPVYLPSNIIENFSGKNDVVLDCFGGTGTTLIACEQLGRQCRMIELDPHYCDVIIQRWENFTGKKAVLING